MLCNFFFVVVTDINKKWLKKETKNTRYTLINMTRDYSIYNKQRPQSSSEEEEFVEEDQPKQKATKKQKTEQQVGEKRKREVARDDSGDQIFEVK